MEKHTWDNGLRVLLLPEKEAMSASVDIWVEAGSRYESPAEQGISHFTEHMLFKGTGRRTARQISEEIDGLGGALNAYTTRAYTRYYAQALAADPHPSGPAQVLDILLDMLLHSRLDPEELEMERGVILEEIAMYEDIGEDLAHEALCSAVWPQSPLGRPVCGYPETVGGITAATLRRYVSQTYTPERMLVVLAGHFDADDLLFRLEESLGRRPRGAGRPAADTPGFCPGITLRAKPFEQVSFEIGFPGLACDDERRYAMMLLNFIVGGGASSRLFQRLREERGLVYSVYSSHEAAAGTGLFTVSASVAPANQREALREIRGVLDDLCRSGGITSAELERARAQIKASVILGMETVAARAFYAGQTQLFAGREIPVRETLDRLDEVTLEQVQALAASMFEGPWAYAAAGPVCPAEDVQAVLGRPSR